MSLSIMGAAQDTNDASKLTRYVVGCLQTGQEGNEYQLIAEHGKWHLRSDTFRLEGYVGQEVKVAGVVSNQPYHGMKEDLKAAVRKEQYRDWCPDCYESRGRQQQLQLGTLGSIWQFVSKGTGD